MRNKALLSLVLPASLLFLAQGLRADNQPQSGLDTPKAAGPAPVAALDGGPQTVSNAPASAVNGPQAISGGPASAIKGPQPISSSPSSAIKSPTQKNDKALALDLKQLKILNDKVTADQLILNNAKQGSDPVLILNAQNQLNKDKAALGTLKLKPSSTPATTPGK